MGLSGKDVANHGLGIRRVPLKGTNQSVAKISQQMPAVGNLNCTWRTFRRAAAVEFATIATNNIDSWMRLEPISEGLRGTNWQKVNSLMKFQITEDCPITMPTGNRPIINSKNPRRF